jgi:hypothetical protein
MGTTSPGNRTTPYEGKTSSGICSPAARHSKSLRHQTKRLVTSLGSQYGSLFI